MNICRVVMLMGTLLAGLYAYAQTDDSNVAYYVEIHKLQEEIKAGEENLASSRQKLAVLASNLRENLNVLLSYADYKANVRKYRSILQQRDEVIDSLKTSISELKNGQVVKRQKLTGKISSDHDKGKRDAMLPLISVYLNNSFDSLTGSTTISSLEKDRQLLSDYEDVIPVIDDLIAFHKAEELLKVKYSGVAVENAINNLSMMGRSSDAITGLKTKLTNYGPLSNSLLETLRTCDLDKNGNPFLIEETHNDRIYRQKYMSIMGKLTQMVFSPEFSFVDYPYLSEIVLEVMKVKKYHPDTDLSYLVDKLN